MKKIIFLGLMMCISLSLNAGGNKKKIIEEPLEVHSHIVDKVLDTNDSSVLVEEYDDSHIKENSFYSKSVDLRGFKFNNSQECQSILTSGIIEIKNKNRDFDLNKVYFKHQRITYVIGDQFSIGIKKCFMSKTEELDIPNLKKLIMFLGN